MGLGLFLAFLLICHVLPLPLPLSVSAEEENKSTNTTCPQNFHCGNLTNQLGFPFFNSSHPSNCGLFMLNCEAAPVPQITFDFLHGPWFSVVNISDPVIKLRYDDFEQLRSTGICNIFHYDDKHLRKTFPSFSYSILHNITLYGCTHNPGTSQRLTDDIFRGYQIYNKCDDDVIIYYQNPGHPAPGKLDVNGTIHAGCKNITLAMVWEDDYSNKTDLFELLTPEFDLEWHLSGNCSTCYSEGLECRVDWSLPGDLRCAHSRKGRKRNLAMKIGIGISAPAMMIILVLLFGWKKRYSLRCWTEMKGNLASVETMLKNQGFLAPKRYSCSDLKKMTNSFKDKLGQGGFGAVYKGALYDGSLVAVKVLNERNGNEEDFINEVASVGRTSHVNIVTLLGFCFQGSKRALVYEFMPNGSLEKFIYAENSLTERPLGWEVLFQIAVGVARGLEYLHQGCNTRILHFDIKPHNILLDKDLCPKISDFGLAKLCPNRASIISMLGARGTAGYIAPEVFSRTFGEVSHKSDVYSYGMVILEMVGGRKNVNLHVDHSSEIYFPHWIYNRLELNEEIGLQDIKNEAEHEKVRKMTIVGLWCIQIDPRRRPSIGRVVEMLEGSLHSLQIPPKPLLSSPARSEALDSTS